LGYLGGSLSQVFLIQPRLWVFMIGKLFWPVDFSADYTLENIDGLSTPAACALLTVVLLLQGWLAYRSPIGALGVAIYWLGLATVSNFMPLNRFLADRFYYLPLAGGAMQLFALLLLLLPNKTAFRALLAACLVAVFPLTLLTVIRQQVFTNNFTLWTDTIKVSPFSSGAHNGLGSALAHRDQIDAAIAEYHKALQLQPDWFQAEINLGNAYVQKGNIPLAVHFYEKALDDYPRIPDAHNNLGVLLLRQGNVDAAMAHFQKALELNPYYELAHVNLGTVLMRKGRLQDAVAEFQEALQIEPGEPQAQAGLAAAEAKLGAPVTSP
jgi:tetratricopeptide (TPR) repeat protein